MNQPSNCPICLEPPLITSTNSISWLCFCKHNSHNIRLGHPNLDMHILPSEESIIDFWNSIVESYNEANPNLIDELPLPCTLCNVIPTPIQNETTTWSLNCVDELKHESNQSGICGCGHLDHNTKHGLFGSYNSESKAKAVRDWNESILRYNKLHEPKVI